MFYTFRSGSSRVRGECVTFVTLYTNGCLKIAIYVFYTIRSGSIRVRGECVPFVTLYKNDFKIAIYVFYTFRSGSSRVRGECVPFVTLYTNGCLKLAIYVLYTFRSGSRWVSGCRSLCCTQVTLKSPSMCFTSLGPDPVRGGGSAHFPDVW